MGSESSWLFKVTSVRPAEASCLSRSCKLQRSESLKTFALFSSGTSIIVWSWSLLHSGVKIRSNSPGRHGADGDKASSQISCGKISCSPSFWTGSLRFACSASSGFAGSTGGLGIWALRLPSLSYRRRLSSLGVMFFKALIRSGWVSHLNGWFNL